MSSLGALNAIIAKGKAEGWSESMIRSAVRDTITNSEEVDKYIWDDELVRQPQLNGLEAEIVAQVVHASDATTYDAAAVYPRFMQRCKRYWTQEMFENLPPSMPLVNEAYASYVGKIRTEFERHNMSLMTHPIRYLIRAGHRAFRENHPLPPRRRRFVILAVIAMLHRLKFCSNVWYKWRAYPLTALERALIQQAKGKYSVYVQLCGDFNTMCPVPVLYLRQMHTDYGFTSLY